MMRFPHRIDIIPGSLLFVVGNDMQVDITHRIAATMRHLDHCNHPGIREIVPSYASIMVIYDENVMEAESVHLLVQDVWNQASKSVAISQPDTVTIGVVYGDKFGDDLANVSTHTGISVDDVATLHASGSYTVGAVGFAPGFTYLVGLPAQLATPRLTTPRLRVPTGSVGIGGSQTGIYALPSAGGWNLIGRSPTPLFDPAANPPVRLKLGDTVRFERLSAADFSHLDSPLSEPVGDGPVEVLSSGMQTTVQDLGRYGVGRYGFSTDGAADRASLVQANRTVGNADGAATLEITHLGPGLRLHRRMQFGLAGANFGCHLNGRGVPLGRMFETMPGDELTFHRPLDSVGARTYLAVRGGFDVPLVLGSASTNLVAGIGGWYGRALLRGDRLSVGQVEFPESSFAPGMRTDRLTISDLGRPFRIVAGVQRDRFDDAVWNRLCSETFTISDEANRVGVRLLGPSLVPIAGADVLSEGIVTGSIQVTGEGQAIIMLPGHATIGGYTKIATVISPDWDRLGQLSPGDRIRFADYDANYPG